ncbi:MAG: extracellular solute-binding protein [Pikeienuella sp.]
MRFTRRDLGRFGLGAGLLSALPRRARAAAPIVAHGISAFGDLKYREGFQQFDFATPDVPTGGTFSTGFGGVTFDSVNWVILKGNPVLGMDLTADSLMTRAADEPDAMYGLLAVSIEYPEDRSYAAFELHPDATFRNGEPVTADDVVFSFEALRSKGHPQYGVLLGGVAEAVAESPNRVRFNFRDGVATRDLPMVVASLPIFQRSWFDTRDFGDTTLEPPMTSGPYALDTDALSPGRSVSYVRRNDYWGWDVPSMHGRYHFGRVRIEYFRDRSAAFEGFKAGAFSFNEEFWSKLWATGYDFPAVTRGEVLRETLPDERPAGAQGYWFNLRRAKFADPRVREAVALAFDFEWSNQTLFYGLYQRTHSFFQGGPMAAVGKPSPAELALLEPLADMLPEGVLDEAAYVPPETDGSGRDRRMLRRAARLLDAAGWQVVDGVRQKDGQALAIEFLSSSPSFDRITNPYAERLKRIGVDATLRRVDPAQYERRLEEYDFDITVDRKAMSSTPGVELRTHFHSANANDPGSENLSGVAHPAVDALVERVEAAQSREEVTAAVMALDRVLRALQIWVPQWSKASHHLAFWDIYGRPPVETKPTYARAVIDRWWIDPEKLARFGDKFAG